MRLQMPYSDINYKKLDVMRKEAEACKKRGDTENASALRNQIVDVHLPLVEEQVKESPELIPLLHLQAREGGIEGACAQLLIDRLANKGIK